MKKYLVLLYLAFSFLPYAQFKDNVFDDQKTTKNSDLGDPAQANSGEVMQPQQQGTESASLGVPTGGEHEEAPGNPGEPVPIDGYVPALIIIAMALILYHKTKNRKVNI